MNKNGRNIMVEFDKWSFRIGIIVGLMSGFIAGIIAIYLTPIMFG